MIDENSTVLGHLVMTTFGRETWIRSESVADPDNWLQLRLPTSRAELASRLVRILTHMSRGPEWRSAIQRQLPPSGGRASNRTKAHRPYVAKHARAYAVRHALKNLGTRTRLEISPNDKLDFPVES